MKTVIEMARETFDVAADSRGRETFSGDSFGIERFAELVASLARADAIAKEREACAKVCENIIPDTSRTYQDASVWDVATFDCAEAIRARSNT